MVRYTSEAEAAKDGIRIVHEPEQQRYAVYQADERGNRLVGEAHYSLIAEDTINFDHTVVLPELRGSGLASLLAAHALSGDAIGSRQLRASCWYIASYLRRHPEALEGR